MPTGPRFHVTIVLVCLTACATAPQNPYPPIDGRWLYDYAASLGDDMQLPPDFEESISRLDREGRSEEHRQLESLAMKLRPPEIIRIEYVGSKMLIRGGGAFERNYELSGLNPTPGIEVTWNRKTLDVTLTDESLEVTEHYELSPDRTRLIVLITIVAPFLDHPLEMRRVYLSSKAF